MYATLEKKELTPFFVLQSSKMVIEWREREHEDIEQEMMENLEALESLRQCGLRKFYEFPNMRV
jgi:hypothetical protein